MSKIIRSGYANFDMDHAFTVKAELPSPPPEETLEEEEEVAEEPTETPEEVLESAHRQAELILKDAKEEADRIVDEGKRSAEAFGSQAKARGKQEGFDEGYAKGIAEAELIKNEARQTLEDAHEEKERLLAEAEPEAVELVLHITEKLLPKIVRLNRSVIGVLIKEGLADVSSTGQITVHVSRDDYQEAISAKDEILAMVDPASKVDFVADAGLGPGDCIIETPLGNIDASLDTQFAVLKENIYLLLENR